MILNSTLFDFYPKYFTELHNGILGGFRGPEAAHLPDKMPGGRVPGHHVPRHHRMWDSISGNLRSRGLHLKGLDYDMRSPD